MSYIFIPMRIIYIAVMAILLFAANSCAASDAGATEIDTKAEWEACIQAAVDNMDELLLDSTGSPPWPPPNSGWPPPTPPFPVRETDYKIIPVIGYCNRPTDRWKYYPAFVGPLAETVPPDESGSGKWCIYLNYDSIKNEIGDIHDDDPQEIIADTLCTATAIVLWHELHHTDTIYGPGTAVPGGRTCEHYGLEYSTATRACNLANKLDNLISSAIDPEIQRGYRNRKIGACQMFDLALRLAKRQRKEILENCPSASEGPPSWGRPSTLPACSVCPPE